jgi:hypothetical protein
MKEVREWNEPITVHLGEGRRREREREERGERNNTHELTPTNITN